MNRKTVYRIVGFAFLAFAALPIYQGEFRLDHNGGVIISRAHDPEVFWRYVIIQIGFGFALLYLSRLAPPTGIAQIAAGDATRKPEAAAERPKLPTTIRNFAGRL